MDMPMRDDIQFIEELSLNAMPALNTLYYDGWVLRFAEGYTSRANSVNVIRNSLLPLEDKVLECERLYKQHAQPCIFKITPNTIELDAILDKRGYRILTPTNIMVKKLHADKIQGKRATVISKGISAKWQKDFFPLTGVSEDKLQVAYQLQSLIVPFTLCASITYEQKPIGCGLGIVERGYVGFYDIYVAPKCRRRGYGYDLCSTILEEAACYGAVNAYLQVVDENEKAKKMYEKLGFQKLYQYWYRIQV